MCHDNLTFSLTKLIHSIQEGIWGLRASSSCVPCLFVGIFLLLGNTKMSSFSPITCNFFKLILE